MYSLDKHIDPKVNCHGQGYFMKADLITVCTMINPAQLPEIKMMYNQLPEFYFFSSIFLTLTFESWPCFEQISLLSCCHSLSLLHFLF